MNKHDLINKSWEEFQDESLEEILADESQDKRVNESQEKVQADDLNEKTETFWVSIQQEFQADE